MQQGFIIPVYNHGATLRKIVTELSVFNLPIIIVDDGNQGYDKECINFVCGIFSNTILLINKRNRGKGYSVCRAVKYAHKKGITHLFQIDADGQHDLKQVELFLKMSKENPEVLISGFPIFDETIPLNRKKGRQISNNYANFVTMTKDYIKDAMCGFRIYPVEPFYKIVRACYIDSYMAFDTEILIRLVWKNVPLIFLPVNVSYPTDGKSNFRMIRDNIRISFMFARMTIGMWIRFPILLHRKKSKKVEESHKTKSEES